MYVNAWVSPPLGTSTVRESSCDAVRFIAALEVTEASNDWIMELWYGRKDCEWKSAAFARASATELTVHDASKNVGLEKLIYTLNLPHPRNPSPYKFTLRFKHDINSPWIWIRDQTHAEDGQVIFRQPKVAASITFDGLFSEPDAGFSAKPVASQTPGVDVFDVSATAPALHNEWSRASIGMPIAMEHFYALVRIRVPWMGPRQGSETFVVDSDALIMGYLRSDGRHVVVLGISGLRSTTTYICSDRGRVVLKSLNDSGEPQVHRALVSTGLDWQSTVDAAFYAARVLLSQSGITEATAPPEMEPLWRESWYDGLGYCTWNSLGRELTQDRVLDSLQDLHDNGIFVTTVIIDDNWQSLDIKMRWEKFEANEYFPNGLKGLTSEIRRRFKHIKHIAVWHAVIGYWEGISPEGWIAANYSTTTIKFRGGSDVTLVDETDIDRLYNDFYRFLRDSGIDSIKCDVQSSLTQFDNAVDRKRLCHAYQDAFKRNGLRHFSGRVIYCMAQVPQIFFHSLLQQNGPTVLVRNSDDFYPDIPDSHLWHVFCNAMNNIFTSHLNCLPDWDMFQTSLPVYGGVHAAGRCISGGPIYITDSPDSHSGHLVNQMSAASVRDPDCLIALRPSRLCLPLDPYIPYNGNRLLKLANVFGGTSMLAVFNVSSNENSDLISLTEFEGLREKTAYVVRQQSTGKVFGPATTATDNTLVSLTLASAGWEFLSAVPVHRRGAFEVGVLGLVSQLTGAAGVVDSLVGDDGQLTAVSVTVKALGVLGFYISDLKTRKIDDLFVTIAGTPVPVYTVTKSRKDPAVLEVDIKVAWKELGLRTRWSNEVVVKLFLE